MASILAVDDEVGILDMIQSILSKDGHSVTGITNPVEINYTKVSSFDLILLDIMMPGIDGFTLCKKLRNQVDCPIVFLTAKSEENSLVNGLSLGADCEFLARNQGQVFTKEQILENVFGYDSESNDSTIITHIKNIRNKLQEFEYAPIKTVWGVGYKWEE